MFIMKKMNQQQHKHKGFTLVESIIGMIIFSFALTVLVMGVYRSSSKSHEIVYQVQASTLGQSILADILHRRFDENSDPNGELYRCGEENKEGEFVACTLTNKLGSDNERSPVYFNDVDDFIGCWGDEKKCSNSSSAIYSLSDLIGNEGAERYHNFTIEINVNYVDINNEIPLYKKVTVTLYASSYATYTFSVYRGNY